MSRIIALSTLDTEVKTQARRQKNDALGLIKFELKPDGGSLVQDRRVKRVVLTAKGRRRAESIVGSLE